MAKKFDKIFIHCSDSEFGTALMIQCWHVLKKWKTIGYHLCVTNGYPTNDWFKNKKKIPFLEASVEVGREIDSDKWFEPFEKGAGVYGFNEGSFHICMIGKKNFSNKVKNKTLEVVKFHVQQFEFDSFDFVYGHGEKDPKKSYCPGIDMNEFRKHLKNNTYYGQKKIFDQVVVKETKRHEPGKKKITKTLVNKLILILGIFFKRVINNG